MLKTEIIDAYLMPDFSEYIGHELTTRELTTASFILNEAFSRWQGSVEDFYKNSSDYLLALVSFNLASHYKLRWYGIQNIRKSKVLDFGCGIGTISIYLANQGNQILGYDINKRAIDFANWRIAKHNFQNVEFTTIKPDCTGFDFILAIDVLEHFKNLGKVLKDLASTMKIGAKFYHYDIFETNPSCLQHFDHSKQIDTYIVKAGLMKLNQFWAMKV